MKKKGRIVTYTIEEIAAKRARGEDKTDWALAQAKTEAQLAADVASDSAWKGVPEDWVKHTHATTLLMQPSRKQAAGYNTL